MRTFISKTIIVFTLAVFTASSVFFIAPSSTYSQAVLTPDQEAALRAELQVIENQIVEQQNILKSKKSEGQTISRDIAILDAQIKGAQLKIKAHNLAIDRLGKDITIKVKTIGTLSERIEKGHKSIAEAINKTNELDNFSVADAFLAKKNLTDFFIDFDALASIQDALKIVLGDVKEAKAASEQEKQELSQKRNQEIDTKIDVEAEKAKIEKGEAEKKKLLSLNKTQQNNYQSVISEKQKRAADIRNALFALRDVAAIKFEDALAYAKAASGVTRVRPAFVLAVIQQESNLGQNVGACYMTDDITGSGVKVASGVAISNVMKPTRDVTPFLQITSELGRDPHKTRISCPFSVGYGGAMGPAQFIASTWLLSKDRIGAAVGKSMPDPWNPRDAFMASAIYLGDLGAGAGGYTAERNAACRYYSGRACSGSNAFYGDQVVAKAKNIQENMIDPLQL